MCTSASHPVTRISEVRKFISEGDWASAGSMSNDIAEHAKEALSMTRFLVAPADTAQAELERLFKETFIITPKSAHIEHVWEKKIATKEVIFAQTVIGFHDDKGVEIPIEAGYRVNLSVIKAVDITDIYDWATDIRLATNHNQPVILSDNSFWSKPVNLKLHFSIACRKMTSASKSSSTKQPIQEDYTAIMRNKCSSCQHSQTKKNRIDSKGSNCMQKPFPTPPRSTASEDGTYLK